MQAWADRMLPTVVNLLGWHEDRFWSATVAEIRRAIEGWHWRWERERERDAWTIRLLWSPHVKKGARLPSIDEILGRVKTRQEILKGSEEIMREIGMPDAEVERLLSRRPKRRPRKSGSILRPDGSPARGSLHTTDISDEE